jgi:hypothetical protein
MSLVAVRFSARAIPLAPEAVVVPSTRWRALAQRLLEEDDASLETMRAVWTDAFAIVIAETERLPWLDGVTYFGRDALAPRLLTPTALAPSVPADLLERAIFARHASLRAPAALLVDPLRITSLADAASFDRAAIASWIDRVTKEAS